MKKISPAWGACSFVFALAVQLSGLTSKTAAWVLYALSAALLAYSAGVWWMHRGEQAEPPVAEPIMGDDNVVIGDRAGAIGDRNVYIGAADSRGNVILNRGGTAIGHGAQADPTSVAIGSGAGAGRRPTKPK